MPTEITTAIELSDSSEKIGLTLSRTRAEEAKSDNEGGILGMDYPAGIVLGD